MWLKVLLCGLTIAFCTLLGWLAAGKYRARRSFFAQLSDLNEKYLAELKYRRTPLPEFLKNCEFTGDFQKTVQSFSAREEKLDLGYLTAEERAETLAYFRGLGRGDSASQIASFENKRAALLAKKTASEKEAKERGELYLKLGLLAGLAFVILIV